MSESKFFQIPKGVLTEISGSSGSGKTEAVLRFLASDPSLRVAWLEADFNVYPGAFPLQGVSLERVFFVDLGGANERTALWAAHQVLSSQLFGVVVLSAPVEEIVALRRLQLAVGKNQSAFIILAEEPRAGAAWPIHLQLRACRSPETGEVRLETLKAKGSIGNHQGGRIPWRMQSA